MVWSRNNTLVVYRGFKYVSTPKNFLKSRAEVAGSQAAPYYKTGQGKLERDSDISRVNSSESGADENICRKEINQETLMSSIFSEEDLRCQQVSGSLYEREIERLLDGLGPRFIDWWMRKPLPVDADLLPEVVPGYKLPFRLCPPRARAKLTNEELTYLRKLAHPLPTHFVLGITLPPDICQFFHRTIDFQESIISKQ